MARHKHVWKVTLIGEEPVGITCECGRTLPVADPDYKVPPQPAPYIPDHYPPGTIWNIPLDPNEKYRITYNNQTTYQQMWNAHLQSFQVNRDVYGMNELVTTFRLA